MENNLLCVMGKDIMDKIFDVKEIITPQFNE